MASGKKKKDDGFRWVARVRDIGFFQGFARTRGRLITAASVATIVALGLSFVTSLWVREFSGYPTLDMLVIASTLAVLIVASYIDGMLIGDLFFPGRWRERVLLGQDFEPDTPEEERTFAREYSVHFLIVVVSCILSLIFVSQKLTGGFFDYYQRLGFALTLMRSDDPSDRLSGLKQISGAYYEKSWDDPALHTQIALLAEDLDPEVRSLAYYAAGRLEVLDAGPALLSALSNGKDSTMRAEAALALGRMRHPDALVEMGMHLRDPKNPEEVRIGVLNGFSYWRAPQVGPNVAAFLRRCGDDSKRRLLSEQEVRFGLHALSDTAFEGGASLAIDLINDEVCPDTTLPEKCSALELLRHNATPDDLTALQGLVHRFSPDARCEAFSWKLRDESPRHLVTPEFALAKVIRAVGNRRYYRAFEWMKSFNVEPYPIEVRNTAGNYVLRFTHMYKDECQKTEEEKTSPRCQL